MSKCDLRIETEKDSYQPGEVCRGKVFVDVNAECTCNGLSLNFGWRTHGRGNRAAGVTDSKVIYTGTWWPGDTPVYDFAFDVPYGPFTYHGHYLNVDWYLDAAADIPWAFDPKASKEVIVEPGAAPTGVLAPEYGSGPIAQSATLGAMLGLVMAGVMLVVALGVGAAGLISGFYPLLIFSGLGVIMACVLGFIGLRNTMAQKKLGEVQFSIEPMTVQPGGSTTVRLRFTPQSDVSLNGIQFALRGYEQVVSGSGTKKKTYSHTLFELKETELEGEQLCAGDAVDVSHAFTLPEDAPFTFRASSNELIWRVSANVDIPRWPDWSHWEKLRVIPPQG